MADNLAKLIAAEAKAAGLDLREHEDGLMFLKQTLRQLSDAQVVAQEFGRACIQIMEALPAGPARDTVGAFIVAAKVRIDLAKAQR